MVPPLGPGNGHGKQKVPGCAMQNKAAGAFTIMATVLLIGGPFHGKISEMDAPGSNIIVPLASPVVTLWNDPPDPFSLSYQQIVYRYEGYWNSPYGFIRVYVLDGTKYIAAELPSVTAKLIHDVDPELIFVLDQKLNIDKMMCLVEEQAFKIIYKQSPDKLALFVKQSVVIKEPPPKQSNVTIETLNEMLKKIYMPAMAEQLEWSYGEFLQTPKQNTEQTAWLNAGLRDVLRHNLCYGCAEEIIGPGFGEANDLKVEKGSGRRVRKLVCGNCGKGKFNRLGQRIGDWEAVAGK